MTNPQIQGERDPVDKFSRPHPKFLPRSGGVLSTIRRRILVAVSVFALAAVASTFVIQNLPKMYSATSVLALDVGRREVLPVNPVVPELPTDSGVLEAEVQRLRSVQVIERVLNRLKLRDHFAAEGKKPGWVPRSLPFSHTPGQDDLPMDPVDNFLARLYVAVIPRTYTIHVTFSDPSPQRAALVANAVAEQYLLLQLEEKSQAAERASKWLSEQLGDLRTKMRGASESVQKYSREAELETSYGESVKGQQLAQLNTQLVLVRGDRAAAEARVRRMEDMVSTGASESLPEVLSSQLIQRLREQESQLRREISDLSGRYGPLHPSIAKVTSELEDIKKTIGDEIKKIVEAARNDANEIRIRERSLESSVRKLQSEVGQQAMASSRLGELEREAEVSRNLYAAFLTRFNETLAQIKTQQADARIVSPARAPLMPSFPPKKLLLGLAFVGSLTLSVLVSVLIDKVDKRLFSARQVEGATGMPVIGMIPKLSGRHRRNILEYLTDQPGSAYAESLQSVNTYLHATGTTDNRILLVTSPLPGDGKTTLAISLAHIAARTRGRVAIIDCDFRRPNASILLGRNVRAGLAEYLLGASDVHGIIHNTSDERVLLIPAFGLSNGQQYSAHLINSPKLVDLLRNLKGIFNTIVIDSPPLLAVSDAVRLSQLADQTLVVVRWGTTRLESAMLAAAQLAELGSDITGAVMTNVNLRKHAGYGFYDQGHFYAAVRKYYRAK